MENRWFTSVLKSRMAEEHPLIQVLIGPRQVGKTTAIKSCLGHSGIYQTADYPTPLNVEEIETWWSDAVAHPDKILAIDEIQKIPGWSEVIKRLWDQDPNSLKIILSGSSALLVEKGLKETLSGRYELIRADHWNLAEAAKVFSLDSKSFVEFGCYPGATRFLDDIDRWGAYIRDSIVEPVLGRDLLQLHPVDQPALLRQLFGVAASLPAQIVSLQKLQGHLQGKGTLPTLRHYLDLLAGAFLVTGLERYSTRAIRTKRSSPKLIVHDNSLIRAFERPIQKKLVPAEFARYLENAIGARLLEAGWDVFYWKERDLEVDFVALGPGGEKWALEVKAGSYSAKDFSGLKKFVSLHSSFEPFVVSWKNEGHKPEGIQWMSAESLLSLRRK